jgi:hypothetical protein
VSAASRSGSSDRLHGTGSIGWYSSFRSPPLSFHSIYSYLSARNRLFRTGRAMKPNKWYNLQSIRFGIRVTVRLWAAKTFQSTKLHWWAWNDTHLSTILERDLECAWIDPATVTAACFLRQQKNMAWAEMAPSSFSSFNVRFILSSTQADTTDTSLTSNLESNRLGFTPA